MERHEVILLATSIIHAGLIVTLLSRSAVFGSGQGEL